VTMISAIAPKCAAGIRFRMFKDSVR